MRILVLTFYYEPDLCAGSFRNTAIVKEIEKQLGNFGKVEVITTLPNRYHTYAADAPAHQLIGNLEIHRIPLPDHHSGMLDQSKAFWHYAKHVWRLALGKEYDLIYASSSRLMTAALAAVISNRLEVPLYLDIRDIFTDSIGDLLKKSPARIGMPLLRAIEKYAIRSASRVNLVSPGFVKHFRNIAKKNDFKVFTNGIDAEFINYNFHCKEKQYSKKEILYAGNIGEGQGLHRIIPQVADKLSEGWCISIIGDGGMCASLKQALGDAKNVNVEKPIKRTELLKRYKNADVLFLHLNDYPAFRKVLPSKIFEYAATGKPILAGVAGEAARFMKSNIDNAEVFEPCDSEGFLTALNALKLENYSRTEFVECFRRETIVRKFTEDILSVATQKKLDV